MNKDIDVSSNRYPISNRNILRSHKMDPWKDIDAAAVFLKGQAVLQILKMSPDPSSQTLLLSPFFHTGSRVSDPFLSIKIEPLHYPGRAPHSHRIRGNIRIHD